MSGPLAAGLAVAFATLFILAWRRPMAALRYALTPQVAIFVAAAALFTGRLAVAQPPAIVLVVGVLLAGIVSLASRIGEVGRVRRRIAELAKADRRAAASRWIVRWARDTRPSARNVPALRWYAPIVCAAAGQLIARDEVDDACAMLSGVPASLPDRRVAASRATLLAMAHLSRGRHDEAAAALDAAPTGELPQKARQMLGAARALLDGVQGKADEALAALETVRDPQLEGLALAVEAHARAARGEVELAKAALGQLREAGGPQALAKVVAHDGPASALAAELG